MHVERLIAAAALAAVAWSLCLSVLHSAAYKTACQRLDDAYSRTDEGEIRKNVSTYVFGRERSVTVFWDGRTPSHAAAALLVTIIRHGLRYQNLKLDIAPTTICELAVQMQQNCTEFDQSDAFYDNLMLIPAIGWSGRRCISMEICLKKEVVPLRLQVTGGGAALLRLRMHTMLEASARSKRRCQNVIYWYFYRDRYALVDCGFIPVSDYDFNSPITVWYSTKTPDGRGIVKHLDKLQINTTLHLRFIAFESDMDLHRHIFNAIRTKNSSVLFLDYELWVGEPGIHLVQPPLCLEEDCIYELNPIRSLRVADVPVLQQLAPNLLKVFKQFSPTSKQIREVLQFQIENSYINMEEAACKWAINNTSTFKSWFRVNFTERYWIAMFLCEKDQDKELYKTISRRAEEFYHTREKFNISVYFVEINCSSESDLTYKFIKAVVSKRWPYLVGVVAAGAGAKMATEYASQMETALVLYDVPSGDIRLGHAVYAAGGTLNQLAIAIRHFFYSHKWKRLAILSEETQLAKDLGKALKMDNTLVTHNVLLRSNAALFTDKSLEILKSLKKMDSRIFFLNTVSSISKHILCLAQELDMTPSNGYVWVLREWLPSNLKCLNHSFDLSYVHYYTITYWWQGQNDVYEYLSKEKSNETNYFLDRLHAINKKKYLPPLSVPISDAIQILIKSFDAFKRKFATRLYDMHGKGTVRLLLKTLEEEYFNGILQKLHYTKGALANPLVFINKWNGNHSSTVAIWVVIGENIKILTQKDISNDYSHTDGSHNCLTTATGNPFNPDCQDSLWLITICVLIITITLLCFSWRIRMRNLAHHDSILRAQLLAQREVLSTTLADHLIDRGALELHHDLGRGCFGRVRYGVLRAPGCLPLTVAVKELLEDNAAADEAELLREAVTIASLRHPHVVRLIGVCTTDGPLLVLMEYAFFGNMQDYLCERRHLIRNRLDCEDELDEAYHVSTESLTRLAREAVSALEYLSTERLVHRDIRANNCLIDEQRSLKLSDFGLARTIRTDGVGGDEEYLCQRRGLFPVLWMAPESLQRGVFTTASDVWALGVLLLELVTLGARPYGNWPPNQVMQYVCDGGHPPLPNNITSELRRLLLRCWHMEPEERLTITEIANEIEQNAGAFQPVVE